MMTDGGIVTCSTVREFAPAIRDTPERGVRLLVVHHFISGDQAATARRLLRDLLEDGRSSIYGTSAVPLYEFRSESGRSLSDYLALVPSMRTQHDQLLEAVGNPLGSFTEELATGLGASVARLRLLGQECFFGQYRCFPPGQHIEPHVDILAREFPALVPPQVKQYAVNLSLSRADAGGDLLIWPVTLPYGEYRGYGVSAPVSPPAVIFTPSEGDLYLFESSYVHSVSPSSSDRCALSGFLAGPWPDDSYRLWS